MIEYRTALALMLIAAPAWAERCPLPLSVGWEERPPYHYLGRDGRPAGYSVELLSKAAANMGCRLSYRRMPWSRTLQELRLGTLDVAMQALRTKEREAYACFVPGYSISLVRLWVRRDHQAQWPVSKLEDLGRVGLLRLGVMRGDSYGERVDGWLKKPPPSVRIDTGETLESGLRKLQLGRVDLLLATMDTVPNELARLPQQPAIVALPPVWRVGGAFYVFSKSSVSPALCGAFSAQLLRMKRDGTVDKLYRSHFSMAYPDP
ncbi:ABC transporter substrate-binding protein [Chromobacterium sp. IIBBL 290-4]|uniref:substrate-binding periplasmic protein n=1 Tax=Chromobacterium sp. IIBBL 290-4 TaxID=2953890 RepID=UPI0020B81C7D|nr:transporter substrate-binding domain-containing protein [Chromobacterium sp. IIBBL 290-4]UTH74379.1 transporter substrate-binding domain-containing protein [Chromobacterium sp. IIBBL 290-4]